jgi:hypothetical protein
MISQRARFVISALMFSFTFCLAGCDATDSTGGDSAFDALHSKLFNRCGSCHGSGSSDTAGGFDLTSQSKIRPQLVGKTGSDYPDWQTFQVNREACLSYKFINAGNADESLVVAIFDTAVAATLCEIKAHDEEPQSIDIADTTLADLKSWINDGAKE